MVKLMIHLTLMTHLMNEKSKLPLKSMDQPDSPPTLMTFSKDLSKTAFPYGLSLNKHS